MDPNNNDDSNRPSCIDLNYLFGPRGTQYCHFHNKLTILYYYHPSFSIHSRPIICEEVVKSLFSLSSVRGKQNVRRFRSLA